MATPALKTNPKVILFTDFDGTVTLQDSNDYLTDNFGMGIDRRRALNQEVINNTMTFRDSFKEMLESINKPFEECKQELLDHIELDPGFKTFYEYALAHNVPVVVLSSGMEPIIRALLGKLVGEQANQIEIVANQVEIDANRGWHIVYHDESDFGHDKSLTIRPYAQQANRPVLLYAGDGVSDLSAAKETDLLFAKEGRDLVTWCRKEAVPFTEFGTYSEIAAQIAALVEGRTTINQLKEN